MKITSATPLAFDFACHSSACRPPTSGGTGGSGSGKSAARAKFESKIMANAAHNAKVTGNGSSTGKIKPTVAAEPKVLYKMIGGKSVPYTKADYERRAASEARVNKEIAQSKEFRKMKATKNMKHIMAYTDAMMGSYPKNSSTPKKGVDPHEAGMAAARKAGYKG